MALRQQRQAPYDRNGDGDVDRELWAEYHAEDLRRRHAQKDAVWQQVLDRWDSNRDGKLTRGEAQAVLAELRRVVALTPNSEERKLQTHVLYLRYFDTNRDGLLEEGERAVGWAFESVAGLERPATNEIRVGVIWQ